MPTTDAVIAPSAGPAACHWRRLAGLFTRAGIIRITGVWLAALVFLSLQPVRPGGAGKQLLHRPFHFAAFGLTSLLLWRFLTVAPRRLTKGNAVRAVLATSLLGAVLEFAQHLIYKNAFEWWDLRDDSIAAFSAILLLYFASLVFTDMSRDSGVSAANPSR
jgi:hypothetical protein